MSLTEDRVRILGIEVPVRPVQIELEDAVRRITQLNDWSVISSPWEPLQRDATPPVSKAVIQQLKTVGRLYEEAEILGRRLRQFESSADVEWYDWIDGDQPPLNDRVMYSKLLTARFVLCCTSVFARLMYENRSLFKRLTDGNRIQADSFISFAETAYQTEFDVYDCDRWEPERVVHDIGTCAWDCGDLLRRAYPEVQTDQLRQAVEAWRARAAKAREKTQAKKQAAENAAKQRLLDAQRAARARDLKLKAVRDAMDRLARDVYSRMQIRICELDADDRARISISLSDTDKPGIEVGVIGSAGDEIRITATCEATLQPDDNPVGRIDFAEQPGRWQTSASTLDKALDVMTKRIARALTR